MKFLNKIKNKNAFTLVELVMCIMIVGILAAVSSLYISETVDLWRSFSFRNEVVSQGRLAIERMMREMRQIYPPNGGVTSGNLSGISFIDIHNATVTYAISGTNLLRNGNVLIGGSPNLTLTYYDEAGTVLSTPLSTPNRAAVFRIEVQLGINYHGQNKTIKSQVFLRNY